MPVSIGTDCSGMEAPIQAIRNLGLCYRHVFSCDIDQHARATIEANFPHGIMYEDLTKRDNDTAPYCDLYVAGFPCQPFSAAGLQQGFKDQRGRGKIFFEVRDYIDRQRPKAFVLENVKGLKTINKGTYFKAIMKSLEQLGGYNLHFQVLDTRQHGVPHTRSRCYIVGIREDADCGTFSYPEPIPCPSMELFLERRPKASGIADSIPPATQTVARKNVVRALRTLKREGSDPLEEPFIVDCDSSEKRSRWKHNVSPCITCGRKSGHWVTNRGRRLLKTEMMRLQGMSPAKFEVAVSETQLGKQLGNTMSVNVLERLFTRLLPAAGLVPRGKALADRWEDGSAVRALAATRGLACVAKFAQSFAVRRRAATKVSASAPAPAATRKRRVPLRSAAGSSAAAKRARRAA